MSSQLEPYLTAAKPAHATQEIRLVGRDKELSLLGDALLRTARGEGGLLYLEAESGGGKSRLIEEFLSTTANQIRSRVFCGQGAHLTASRPFEILTGLSGRLAEYTARDPAFRVSLQTQLGPAQIGTLTTLFPELRKKLEVPIDDEHGPEEFAEQRTLRALKALLSGLGQPGNPAVIILDDCQWADELTLRLLLSWQRERIKSSCFSLIILAFRTREVEATHPLRSEEPICSIQLPPFPLSATEELLTAAIGRMTDDVTKLVFRASGGNPFLVVSLARTLIEAEVIHQNAGTWRIADENHDLLNESDTSTRFIERRIQVLDQTTRTILSAAAVLGKYFVVDQVAAITMGDLELVKRVLAEAARRYLIKPVGPTEWMFIHDKLREATLAQMMEQERKDYHLAAARLIRSTHKSQVFDLAYHYHAGGAAELAAEYALLAANLARRRHSLEISERYYRIAEAAQHSLSPEQRYSLLEGLGEVLMLRGSYQEATEYFDQVKKLAKDPLSQARALRNYGELCFKKDDVRGAEQAFEMGLTKLGEFIPVTTLGLWLSLISLALLQVLHTLFPKIFVGRVRRVPDERMRLMGQLYNRLSYAQWFGSGVYWCMRSHLRGLCLMERFLPTLELAHAYSAHGPAMTMISYYSRGIEYTRRAIALQSEFNDRWSYGQCKSFSGITLYGASQFSEALEQLGESLRVLDDTGDPWEANICSSNIGLALYRLGYCEDALSHLRSLFDSCSQIHDLMPMAVCVSTQAKIRPGEISIELVKELFEQVGTSDIQSFCQLSHAKAIHDLMNFEVDAAIEVLELAWSERKKKSLSSDYVMETIMWLATAYRIKAQRERTKAWAQKANRVSRMALLIARRYRNSLPHALRERALVLALMGAERGARECLSEGLAVAKNLMMFYEEAQLLLTRAHVGAAFGWETALQDHKESSEMFDRCKSSVNKLLAQDRAHLISTSCPPLTRAR